MSYIDTRNLAKRLEELQAAEEYLKDARKALENADEDDDIAELQENLEYAEGEFGEEEEEELEELKQIESEVSEFEAGNALIPEDEFVEYCMDMLSDIGDLPRNIPWYIVIDREATADNLKADYGEVEYQGTTYLYRVY
jgi:hypothetical protein